MFKAAQHVHTTNSDGQNPLNSVVEDHYQKGFDILCITEHARLTRDWVIERRGLTQERFDEIAAGVDRDGRHMLQIPLTNEQPSTMDEMCTFFVNFSSGSNLANILAQVTSQNGLAHFNHPGRYTGGWGDPGPSNDPANIAKYAGLYTANSRVVGLEIINKKDGESRHERILWDNLSTQLMPGRSVWGFSNDDSHANRDTGFAFNMFTMPENTLEHFRNAMVNGNFYAVSRIAWNEGVNNQDLNAATPVIKSIVKTAHTITITAEHYSRIEWISEGSAKIAEGNVLNLAAASGKAFVRANVIGAGGIAFSQPLAI